MFSKLTPASDIWWFFTLLLISKTAFLHNWEFSGKILIFENTNYDRKTGNTNNLFEKNILVYIFFDIIEYV